MRIYRKFEEIKFDRNTILTVGTFDGVHKGHRVIIKQLLECAERENLRAILLTMAPHPQIILKKEGEAGIKLLTTVEERLILFEKYGLEHVLVVPFNYEFSRTPPEVFVKDFLSNMIGLKKILIGYDHMFGRNREGDEDLLLKLSKELSFKIERIDSFQEKDITISSTKIRKALSERNPELASELLGYDYFVAGKVVYGDRRGAELGYPTANIEVKNKHKLIPANAVYLVSSEIGGRRYFGMANLGVRPTFSDESIPKLEVNFFDFNSNIYDFKLNINFLKYIRQEKKFDGIASLIAQLDEDKNKCKELIKKFYF